MINALKLVCDVLFYLTFITLLPMFTDSYPLLLTVILTTFVAGYLNDRYRNIYLRIMTAFIPLISLLLMNDSNQLFFLAILLGYLFIMLISGKNDIGYEQYRYWFGIMGLPILAAIFVFITSSLNNYDALACGCVYLVLGTVVLTVKRMGKQADKKAIALNNLSILSVIAVTAAACLVIYFVLSHSRAVFEIIVIPVALVIRGLIGILVVFGNAIRNPQSNEPVSDEPKTADEIYDEIFNPDESVISSEEMTREYFINILQRIILVVLALIIIALILYGVYRLVRNLRKDENDEEYAQGNGSEKIRKIRKQKSRSDLSNRKTVRDIYRNSLYVAKRKGVAVDKQTTSEEIINTDVYQDDENAIRLREIYIKARYQSNSEVTDADVAMARECLERLSEL